MKLNTSIFLCLFFSAIIAIKADLDDYDVNDYEFGNEDENKSIIEEEQTQDVQEEADDFLQEPQVVDFQYKRSKRLEEMEHNMPDSSKTFIADGKVKETLTNTLINTMATDVAKAGFADASQQWQLIFEGPEASRVVGTFGRNFNTIVTSNDAADMINMLASTAHVLLAKAGESKMSSGLSDIISMTYSLLMSPDMPDIVNKAGGLVITAVDKPGASLFTYTFWNEMKKLLSMKNLNEKLKKYFGNIFSMMNSLGKKTKGGNPLRRTRSLA